MKTLSLSNVQAYEVPVYKDMSGADEELTQMSDINEELMSGMDEELVQ